MKIRIAALAACPLALLAVTDALASGSSATVTVRVEGATKTLLTARTTQTPPAAITRGHVPSTACPGDSALGALQAATHGGWIGRYKASKSTYKVTAILGEHRASGWVAFVNGRPLQGNDVCGKLKSGKEVLFANAPAGEPALILSSPSQASAGSTFNVKVTAYGRSGAAKPVAGATISVNGHSGPTNASGVTPLTPDRAGTYTIAVTKPGYVRDEAVVVVK
jgi:hypothetical protein